MPSPVTFSYGRGIENASGSNSSIENPHREFARAFSQLLLGRTDGISMSFLNLSDLHFSPCGETDFPTGVFKSPFQLVTSPMTKCGSRNCVYRLMFSRPIQWTMENTKNTINAEVTHCCRCLCHALASPRSERNSRSRPMNTMI